uniref:PDZ domain-containing protein n=1 Tax=Pavo cristatus TaxID=9049 RepID=A0A8C9LDY3_PAVCR
AAPPPSPPLHDVKVSQYVFTVKIHRSAYFFYSQLPFPSCFVEMTSVLQARECKVTKKPKKSYGFFLRVEKDTAGHLIRNVEKNSPAEKAGVQNKDRLIEINGKNVENNTHEEVVEKVLVCVLIRLLFWPIFTDQNIPITDSMADPVHDASEPPAYTETSATEPERTSPEPRERVSITVLNKRETFQNRFIFRRKSN